MAGAEEPAGGAAAGVALPPRILNMTVPQVGQRPLMALRPFFIISSTASTISFLALHLTQYPSAINYSSPKRPTRPAVMGLTYGLPISSVNSENQRRKRSNREKGEWQTLGAFHHLKEAPAHLLPVDAEQFSKSFRWHFEARPLRG